MTDPAEADAPPPVPVLREPRDGVPEPLTGPDRLDALVAGLRGGEGPVALEAERASGYRYSQRAYLVQLRRSGVGTALIDPIALPDLSGVGEALDGAEWILHAASQDLPCLAEVGMRPSRLFDTELAGRLLGDERVALGTMVEKHLGVGLEKGHSAADWSTRPLPYDWLIYAALDVELLVALRDVLAERLAEAGKTEWAQQEFEAVRLAPPHPPRTDPWRRTSGIHKLRTRRQLALVRGLWRARDAYAAERDIAPGRVLPDFAIVEAARNAPATPAALTALPVFGGPRQRRRLDTWFGALDEARRLPDDELPPVTMPAGEGMPSSSRWRERDPEAAARLVAARAVVAALADEHTVLAQNLLASDVVRQLCWRPPGEFTPDAVAARLAELGARPWQVTLTAGPLGAALQSAAESD
ncbi:HRDC domain-containing protein [Jatrophihabitans endophyticus]|uniref:HRDC domain-containing protein n=1 Tax=Jatrophihabitans endophyticus TaxID=1206085 RepID=UPI001A0B3BEE|nr:HRDC domain-containing protein [Jatrophihabitans endophyticus]MBE7187208.1 ribonuclease D [Jatrophihabitans endophyticus]